VRKEALPWANNKNNRMSGHGKTEKQGSGWYVTPLPGRASWMKADTGS